MLDSNVPKNLMQEIISLVPDTIYITDEYWRIVPNTQDTFIYSVSSKRNILVRHSRIDSHGRNSKCTLVDMRDDKGTVKTSIRRSSKEFSCYIEHIRYDTFPELNIVKTLDDDMSEAVDIPYEGLDWYGRHKEIVHILPVSEEDMTQVRQFYSEDLPREIWTYVPDTNRKYVISSQFRGVILKRYRVDGAILKAKPWQLHREYKASKYLQCCISVGDKQTITVSHIYALCSFIPKPGDEYEVNHIDGDTHNNILDNLEWVTRQENSDHYNHSPEMAERRSLGYKHISEWGKLHQKEIQNRPEVNAKRSISVSNSWTEERKKKQSEYSKTRWENATEEQRMSQISGILNHNKLRHNQKEINDEN